MNQKQTTAITPTRSEDYPQWYQQVIKAADLAENSPVRGCMVIKPWGYALWENIRAELDKQIKATGHENACFPLLIPLSFLEKEAAHVEGFAKECAVVTHHRLEADGTGKLVPASPLEEPYVIRPTSETIIGHHYAKWVSSYRDLPILINQWANVMRWEMRPRLFLRSSEFFWQEGHTVHATEEEARAETLQMLDVYSEFTRDFLALPVIKGEKTADERFPGAVNTYTIEAMMQDGRALQSGTSHFLGQNFAKASEIKFLDQNGQSQFAWTTSWGVTTRLIGGVIMVHGDDDGLRLPPKAAPVQIVIIPIYKDLDRGRVIAYCDDLAAQLGGLQYAGSPLRVKIDDRPVRGGEKTWQHVKKGVPIRVEVGLRDIEASKLCVGRRDKPVKDKLMIDAREFVSTVSDMLANIHDSMLANAEEFLRSRITPVKNLDDFIAHFKKEDAGFALCPWADHMPKQDLLKELKVTARCIPLTTEYTKEPLPGKCVFSGKETKQHLIFARSY